MEAYHGALPLMNEHDWNLAFEKYKQIAQYKFVNAYFTLSDFKSIFLGMVSPALGR
ncbi:MAG: hypothetical protein IPP73_15320 [Chitinophagaceae bacterium]|nr:hypothetical protein [Chitinophagaceae bacterium]